MMSPRTYPQGRVRLLSTTVAASLADNSRRLLILTLALALAGPGPAFAAGIARATIPGEAGFGTSFSAPILAWPFAAAPSLILSPAALSPTLSAPSIAPALQIIAAAAAAKPVVAAKPSLENAAREALKLSPETGGAEAKAGAGRSFEGAAESRPESVEVAGADSERHDVLLPSSPSAAELKTVPAPPTLRTRALKAWPAVVNTAVAAAAAFLLYKFGAAGAGLLPVLGLAGTLGWSATPGSKAAFLAGIRNAAAPGTVLTYKAVGEIGARLGLDADKAGALFAELVEEGHLAIRENRDAVYHSFRSRVDGNPLPGDEDALKAVKLMNSGASADHARAAYWADEAVAAIEAAGGAERLAEAKALRGNAALELASGMIAAHGMDLLVRETRTPQMESRLADAHEVLAWTKTATYQAGHTPAMPAAIHRKLIKLLSTLNPSSEDGKPLPGEVADGYIAALDLFERFDPRDFLFQASKSAAPAGSWTPSEKQASAFIAEVRARTSAGETVTLETLMRAGKAQALDTAQINAVVSALGARGELMILGNGKVIYFDLRDQAESDRDGVWDLHNEAIDAIALVNAPGLEDHLRAVAKLDALRQKYFDARKLLSTEAAAYQQVLIALANAKLEAASDVLRHQEKALPAGDARLAGIRHAQAWLAHAYYSAERRQRVDAASLKALNGAASLGAFRDALGAKTEPLITQGVMQTRSFLNGLRADAEEGAESDGAPAPHPSGWRPLAKKDYPALTAYGIDLTGKAVEGKLPPMIGRAAELRQVVKTLLRVEKNNPLIIGEKGVGKTALANGLALQIAAGEIPQLEGRSIIKLDLTKIVAGTTLRGQFEERMVAILDEAKKSNGRVLLFIDEIHMIVGAGDSEGSTDAANILKESLADGSISVIGATTMEEYRKIEKDGALARRFNAVKLLSPTKAEAELIVEGVKGRYEAKHKVAIGAETVKAVVALASRYITDRNLPDSALDLLDDASAEAELSRRDTVLPEDVAREIALRTGIPAGKVGAAEKDQLKNLPQELGAVVIGQAEAVAKVAKGVQRGRMGLRNVKQPIGSFIFLGPTGVGKTEIARQTAKTVFGSEKNMIRLDMSEYMEKHSVSRMIGAPPGYAGFDQAGQLTEAVRRNPYAVILLDEIEKAHPEVLDVLLQVIEDGRLTDGQGRTVDFSNTIIMMTSNIGGSLAGEDEDFANRNPIGFLSHLETNVEPSADARRAKYLKALKAKLRPEFVNRVGEDGIVVFNELRAAQMSAILDLRVRELEAQLKERGVTIVLSSSARAEILKRGEAQKAYGARPLKQLVERDLSDAVVSAELEGRIAEGDAVLLDWDAAKRAFTAEKIK